MAKCDEGYLCDVCSTEVEDITDSDLYLRYVIGSVDPETLHTTSERHLRCHPELAQFIQDDRFEPVTCSGPFSIDQLDPEFVKERSRLVTRGYRRLHEVAGQEMSILDYPLPEVRAELARRAL